MRWAEVILKNDAIEWYECTRALNQREGLVIWCVGRKRFNRATKREVTRKGLIEEGWKLTRRARVDV